jgi:hypothetical protein
VKLAPVEYLAAPSVSEATHALAADDGAKVIAGHAAELRRLLREAGFVPDLVAFSTILMPSHASFRRKIVIFRSNSAIYDGFEQ